MFWTALIPSLRSCLRCKASAYIKNVYYKWCALVVTLFCTSNHETTWYSQLKINGISPANLLIPASLLFTGGTFSQFKEICDAFGLKCLGKTFYHNIQRKFLFPCVHKEYKIFRVVLIDKITELGTIDVSGNGRCDSPGYNAKYSTYSLMDSITNQVIPFYVIHFGTVENSSRMEKAGLIKMWDKIETLGSNIRSLTTDRLLQVAKYMREERSHIIHQYDIWHFTKSIKKTFLKAAKKEDCGPAYS